MQQWLVPPTAQAPLDASRLGQEILADCRRSAPNPDPGSEPTAQPVQGMDGTPPAKHYCYSTN